MWSMFTVDKCGPAFLPPAAVDGESWMIVLWDLQEQGVPDETVVSDGGLALHQALKEQDQLALLQRDVCHVFHQAANIQGRVEAALEHEEGRLQSIQRSQRRKARGERFSGEPATTTLAVQEPAVAPLLTGWEAVADLFEQLHQLLEVVILEPSSPGGWLSAAWRQEDRESLVGLLFDLEEQAPLSLKADLPLMARQRHLALPCLLHFPQPLERLHQQARDAVAPEGVALMAWAWQRRSILGADLDTLTEGFASALRPIARHLFEAWEQALGASSLVENWHSMLRPHLALPRTLSAGMLALLAVWHTHRVAPRGLHAGLSPLQRSQGDQVDADWLTAPGSWPVAA